MEHYVGDAFRVENTFYRVSGKIQYKNVETQRTWYEYRVFSPETGEEAWYSCDIYKDENWLTKLQSDDSLEDVYFLEQEALQVVATKGVVGDEVGDTMVLKKHQDAFGKNVKLVKSWSEKEEYFSGYCEGARENPFTENMGATKNRKTKKKWFGRNKERTPIQKSMLMFRLIVSVLVLLIASLGSLWNRLNVPSAIEFMEDNPMRFIHVHSLISEQEDFADVYMSTESMDDTAIAVIEHIEGKAEEVQQNAELGDDSIAILTEKEYCFIYKSENNQVLVQVCKRKYAYTCDHPLFQGTELSNEFYKHFYYTWGYRDDRVTYLEVASPYMTYQNTVLNVNNGDKFLKYAKKIRERNERKSFW